MTNETVIVEEIKFGEVKFYNGTKFPVIEVSVGNKTGYLSPYRGYKFQVSETFDGIFTLSETSIINLTEAAKNWSITVLDTYAELCVYKFANRYANNKYTLPFAEYQKLSKFVEVTKEYLLEKESELKQQEKPQKETAVKKLVSKVKSKLKR